MKMAIAYSTVSGACFFAIALCLHNIILVSAADPDIVTDFMVPDGVNASTLDGSFFTSSVLRQVKIVKGTAATVSPVNSKVFPALEGLGVIKGLHWFFSNI
ncbi:hypothetical protein Mapa_014820 [Marchantia paleacea]|nr:hypothetical protein Mapa_014820 [Marchantia paleacea]